MSEHGTHAHYDVDIVIVGAGPIGLMTACALGHHGIQFRLFEEKPKPKPYSRANNVWARPQELLESIGVRAALAEKSYLIKEQTVLFCWTGARSTRCRLIRWKALSQRPSTAGRTSLKPRFRTKSLEKAASLSAAGGLLTSSLTSTALA